mgnify:CR=1 FL=1
MADHAVQNDIILEVKGISKFFPGVKALDEKTFQVELAKNSDIGRMRYRNLIEYSDHGVWVIIKPKYVAAMKKAKQTGFRNIVKVVDNRGNLGYHPWADEMKEYNKKHKNQNSSNSGSKGTNPFDVNTEVHL